MQSIPLRIEIPPQFLPYLSDTIVRFRYLQPDIELEMGKGFVLLSKADAPPASGLDRDFLFCLYRQKIYAETLPLRSALIAGVTGA
ncbi:hypothetical protein ACIQUB_16435 [Rhizobium sp. NPDC090275]|uniref:hypothetical protein n=1 Tax=Rhizobium sp. NPDC090275 TaxID=3364498 RepID=UPI00383A1B34